MINPSFKNINRQFVLSFKNRDDDPARNSFNKYYMPPVEIKNFNALIDKKPFLRSTSKKKVEAYEELVEMYRNDLYTTGNLLDYSCHQNYCKLTGIYLSRQKNTAIPHQINFTRKLEEDDCATMPFSTENQQKTILNFS